MTASRLIVLSVAVAAAGGAGVVAKKMAAPAPPAAVQATPLALTDVLVLSADVAMGASLDGAVRWQPWPAESSADLITRAAEPDAIAALKGSIARTSMAKGEPLRRSKLIGEGQNFMASVLPAGKRAVATQIAADTSAGGFILPNDFVDVIMTRHRQETGKGGGSSDSFITETILKNIRRELQGQAVLEDARGLCPSPSS